MTDAPIFKVGELVVVEYTTPMVLFRYALKRVIRITPTGIVVVQGLDGVKDRFAYRFGAMQTPGRWSTKLHRAESELVDLYRHERRAYKLSRVVWKDLPLSVLTEVLELLP